MNIADPWRYFGIAGTEENYAPPPEKGTWFKLTSRPLGNGAGIYSEGGNLAVAVIWEPRPMFEGMDAGTPRAVFDALREGVHSPVRRRRRQEPAGQTSMLARYSGSNRDLGERAFCRWCR
jgi:hypothetical protein